MTDSGSMRLNGGDLISAGSRVVHSTPVGNFWTDVLSEGTTFGNSEPLVRTISTLMTQGSWEALGPFGNRAPAIVVEIEGETADALNAGEVWLSALMGPGELEWLPPGQTVWTVFDAVWCYINRSEDDRWDLDENVWKRRYAIPIKSLPNARSQSLTLMAAEGAGTITDVLVTDGSSATGWTGGWNRSKPVFAIGTVTPTVVTGAVRATEPTPSTDRDVAIYLEYAFGSTVPTATPYLRVDVRWRAASPVSHNGVANTTTGIKQISPARMSTETSGGTGSTAYRARTFYYRLPDGTTTFRHTVSSGVVSSYTPAWVEVDQVRRMSRLPDLGTNRQRALTLIPGGSAPADGSLHVSHPTDALGKVLVSTFPIGRPSPALMQYRTSAGGSAQVVDATQANGEYWTVTSTPLVLTIPDSGLPTRGAAALWAKVTNVGAITLGWTLQPQSGGVSVGQPQTGTIVLPSLPAGPQLIGLGLINLPGAVVGADGTVVLTFSRLSAGGTIGFDEIYAFGIDDESALTIVDAGTGTVATGGPSSNMWINAPTSTKPAGEVLIGTSTSDARWPNTIQSQQVHKFPPEGVSMLVLTTNAVAASTDMAYYKRWTHHAADSV